ncbi:hypothetical protein A3C75_02010 [Candidatus Giovannonibacteria bacterium RIFCSPHIGHO2_02_FULL_44_31]|uniref:Uncharacterized protein n=1 Tax=Candidatus Giovannonibacteria bacterium RIFCSPLOWO2_12_FULL_44_15 TaxID=1798364 RepID=A0A1F5XZW5_9BACT|nr:MAG: hypothetical protein A3C75_02010 [Candidatus Giovannonibacteria bacterium RIFCSPHIGHO2_02_FULL_44_31]OGF75962.1 MAG: hypothetical protein A3E62_00240 [Candidatus Giovannonibacteria bacterium RIFCSPHIGHO2_12_FULL_44_29]OGF93330.1 MAG: hypothetical protein A3G54_00285 [Candidatus Giovannonibacteria bacterium RIFCSPLOWO2_12_FULL_44_15]
MAVGVGVGVGVGAMTNVQPVLLLLLVTLNPTASIFVALILFESETIKYSMLRVPCGSINQAVPGELAARVKRFPEAPCAVQVLEIVWVSPEPNVRVSAELIVFVRL